MITRIIRYYQEKKWKKVDFETLSSKRSNVIFWKISFSQK
jgi:hypothetical protein